MIRKAIQLLRESTVEEDYAAAFSEMGEREGAKPPDATVEDGIGDPV
ncbi:hypothetical protein [Streptosporangium subroseum]|nr:hypothetical protein OHB15_38245 [Streptosporangium subroseum]